MSRPEYPLTHDGDLTIPGHAVDRWRRRRANTAKSLVEAYDEALHVHSPDVYGRSHLHAPSGTILVTAAEDGGRTLKTVKRDDGDIRIVERREDARTRLSPCTLCGNEFYDSRAECPWCQGTGVVG